MRLIALLVFIIWYCIACVPMLISMVAVGFNRTEKWVDPIFKWASDKLD